MLSQQRDETRFTERRLHDSRGRYMLGVAFLSLVTGIAVMVIIIKRTLRY